MKNTSQILCLCLTQGLEVFFEVYLYFFMKNKSDLIVAEDKQLVCFDGIYWILSYKFFIFVEGNDIAGFCVNIVFIFPDVIVELHFVFINTII